MSLVLEQVEESRPTWEVRMLTSSGEEWEVIVDADDRTGALARILRRKVWAERILDASRLGTVSFSVNRYLERFP